MAARPTSLRLSVGRATSYPSCQCARRTFSSGPSTSNCVGQQNFADVAPFFGRLWKRPPFTGEQMVAITQHKTLDAALAALPKLEVLRNVQPAPLAKLLVREFHVRRIAQVEDIHRAVGLDSSHTAEVWTHVARRAFHRKLGREDGMLPPRLEDEVAAENVRIIERATEVALRNPQENRPYTLLHFLISSPVPTRRVYIEALVQHKHHDWMPSLAPLYTAQTHDEALTAATTRGHYLLTETKRVASILLDHNFPEALIVPVAPFTDTLLRPVIRSRLRTEILALLAQTGTERLRLAFSPAGLAFSSTPQTQKNFVTQTRHALRPVAVEILDTYRLLEAPQGWRAVLPRLRGLFLLLGQHAEAEEVVRQMEEHASAERGPRLRENPESSTSRGPVRAYTADLPQQQPGNGEHRKAR